MSKDDQSAAFERIVSANLARAVEFVRFAETKNAALLTFCSAWIVVSVNMLKGAGNMSGEYVAALTVALSLFALAAMISVLSIAPRLLNKASMKAPVRSRNLLFFGDIAPLDIDTFKQQFTTRYQPEDGQSVSQAYLDDLMTQIAINSKIAARKMRFFHWASRVAFLAIMTLLSPALWWSATWLLGSE
jgi:hypothetical protein